MTLALILTGVIVVQLATLVGLIVVARRTAGPGAFGLSEEEAEAEAYLTNTVERLLQDLQQSADRATPIAFQSRASPPPSPSRSETPASATPTTSSRRSRPRRRESR